MKANFIFCLFISVFVIGCQESTPPLAAQPPLPSIAIDGELDDPLWQKAVIGELKSGDKLFAKLGFLRHDQRLNYYVICLLDDDAEIDKLELRLQFKKNGNYSQPFGLIIKPDGSCTSMEPTLGTVGVRVSPKNVSHARYNPGENLPKEIVLCNSNISRKRWTAEISIDPHFIPICDSPVVWTASIKGLKHTDASWIQK